jgi:hypothetical protein
VIVKNISREYGIRPGDRIRIRAGGREGDLTVSGICDNYMYDTFYISKETYEKVFDTKPEIRSALVSLAAGGAEQDEISEEMIRSEKEGKMASPSQLLSIAEPYRAAIENLFSAPYGSIDLIQLEDLSSMVEAIHLWWMVEPASDPSEA